MLVNGTTLNGVSGSSCLMSLVVVVDAVVTSRQWWHPPTWT